MVRSGGEAMCLSDRLRIHAVCWERGSKRKKKNRARKCAGEVNRKALPISLEKHRWCWREWSAMLNGHFHTTHVCIATSPDPRRMQVPSIHAPSPHSRLWRVVAKPISIHIRLASLQTRWIARHADCGVNVKGGDRR